MVIAIGSVVVQQLNMLGYEAEILNWPYLWHIGGCSCLLLMLYLCPRIPALEAISLFSYTIYLWHPLANGVVRFLLQQINIQYIAVFVIIGFISGVLGPILFHYIMAKMPVLVRTLFIGR